MISMTQQDVCSVQLVPTSGRADCVSFIGRCFFANAPTQLFTGHDASRVADRSRMNKLLTIHFFNLPQYLIKPSAFVCLLFFPYNFLFMLSMVLFYFASNHTQNF